MSALRFLPLILVLTIAAPAQQTITFATDDGGQICADLYGHGNKAIVLAHGGQFKKESWHDQASTLATAGFQVLAIDFRSFGCSKGPGQDNFDTAPFEKDVLAAVHYLKAHGATSVSVVGGSFGGAAAGDASIKAPGAIDRIVFLGSAPNLPAQGLTSRILIHRRARRPQWRWLTAPRHPGPVRQSSSAQAVDHPRRLRARPVSLPNQPKRPRHAGDRALSLRAIARP